MKQTRSAASISNSVRSLVSYLAISSASILAGCGGGDASDSMADAAPNEPAPVGTFNAEASCPVEIPVGVRARCGLLEVPEDYAKPEGPKLQLQVAIFESTSKTPATDPLVYLSGGPGAGAVSALSSIAAALSPLLVERDVVAIDQRGTGFSQPALTCPELDSVVDPQGMVSAVATCHDRFIAQGIELSQYNTANNARDVRALARALGAKSMNLLGTSYGTRLAQEIMRQAPESLRSVTLDSTLPPDLDALAQTAVAAERAFRQVFIACAEDLTCREAFPDIEARFYEVVATLNEHPLLVQNGDEQTRIDGERFVQLLGLLQYDIDGVVRIPGIIAEAESGQSDTIQQLDLLRAAPDAGIAAGMNLSVVCAEYAPLTSVDKVALAERGVRPEISSVFNAQKYLVACPIWSVPAAPATESMPVRSSVSTLILEGSFDPSTPPSWGDHVASGLSRAHIALIGAATHGVARTECGMTALASFVHDPANYTHPGCVAQSSPQLWTQAAMSGAMK